eukprot:353500-Chlamydomonas_euryale.AAC.12
MLACAILLRHTPGACPAVARAVLSRQAGRATVSKKLSSGGDDAYRTFRGSVSERQQDQAANDLLHDRVRNEVAARSRLTRLNSGWDSKDSGSRLRPPCVAPARTCVASQRRHVSSAIDETGREAGRQVGRTCVYPSCPWTRHADCGAARCCTLAFADGAPTSRVSPLFSPPPTPALPYSETIRGNVLSDAADASRNSADPARNQKLLTTGALKGAR